MPRHLKLVRRVTATAGGWVGDGADWSESSPPPEDGSVNGNATQDGIPVFAIPLTRRDAISIASKGAAGYVRVTGADSTRRFDVKVFVEFVRTEEGQANVSDWFELTGATTADLGNGEDFTTDPTEHQDQRIAFHLTPQGGNLADGSVVEVWAAEI